MKAGELYIEQVLIGTLVIGIGAASWLPELSAHVKSLDTASALAGSSLALGLAFWIGIPLDRLADTISDRLDCHNRLRFGLDRARGTSLQTLSDLYPEDRLRIASLREGEAVVDWIDYHRSRIRLARALAFYGPALTLALTIGSMRIQQNPVPPLSLAWPATILISYILWALLTAYPKNLPRTDNPDLVGYAKDWGFIDTVEHPVRESRSTDLVVWASEWRCLAAPVFLLTISLFLAISRGGFVLLVAAVGISLTILSAWTWWRISDTYRGYLYDLDRHPPTPRAR